MSTNRRALYFPKLRMKAGELMGIADLAEDIKGPTVPHMIVPPRTERDEELQRALMHTEAVPGAGVVLSKYWIDRPVLLNPKYLFDDFGEATCGLWLPKAFELARTERVLATPVAYTSDLTGSRIQAFKDCIDARGALGLALHIHFSELSDLTLGDQVKRAFDQLDIAQNRVVLLADFENADFTNPDIAAGVVQGVYEGLQELGHWKAIVFQGTNYPEANPADHGGSDLVPRNEWLSWVKAVRFDKDTDEHLIFGDYAADCAKMVFGKSGARAIRHLRYTTPKDWLVVRGAEEGGDKAVMQEVCKRILESGQFAGRTFSSADDAIYRMAQGPGGPGTAKHWRGINTTHHITRVVRDVGKVKGLVFEDRKVAPGRQLQMFDSNL